MKKLILALAAVILLAGLSAETASAAGPCGDTYIVRHRDNLTSIARYCATTVGEILALNPQIKDPNIIITGQELTLTGSPPGPPPTAATYTVQTGDTLQEIANMFGTSLNALKDANPALWSNSTIYPGQALNIPAGAISSYPRVGLSATSTYAGDDLTIYVSSFPPNAWIDYRIGEEGEEYSLVVDGTVSGDGTAVLTVEVPGDADYGEYWVVHVLTTSQAQGVEAYSARIFINW